MKDTIIGGVRPDGRRLVLLMAFDWYKNIRPNDLDASGSVPEDVEAGDALISPSAEPHAHPVDHTHREKRGGGNQ